MFSISILSHFKKQKEKYNHSYNLKPMSLYQPVITGVNSSPPGQNGRHFADGIFKCIFMNEKFCILIKISLKLVPNDLIDNKTALIQVMAWRRAGDKPLPEPMLMQFTDAYMRH